MTRKPITPNSSASPPRRSRSSWAFPILVCLFSCLLLLVNGAIVAAGAPLLSGLASELAKILPRLFNTPKVMQILAFILPIAMMFLEWAIVDWIVDHLPHGEKKNDKPERN